ncbi:hypothetical protein B566_EDAN002846 [Ephemera danica]|nr:hypothetical protein B566_EDAN002846 [Ephemera danica]
MICNKHINKSFDYAFLSEWLGDGLLISSGAKWHSRRKLLTPAFHFSILEQFVPVFCDKTRIFVSKLGKHVGNPDGVDIVPLITRCNLDIICQTAMGTNIDAQEELNSPYVNAITDLKVIRERREELKNLKPIQNINEENNDVGMKRKIAFLDLLLQVNEGETPLSDDDIREEVDTFMFEGHDTTAMAISWTLFFIGSHDNIQSRCMEELEAIFFGADRDPNMTDLSNMKYLERVIKESLRLRPSVYMIYRQLKQPLEMGGIEIPISTKINIQIMNIHRNPEVYPDPEKFDPDRFLPENCVGRHPYAYIPFSAGPRNCIGQKFAMLEMKEVMHFTTAALILGPLTLLFWLWRRPKHPIDALPGPLAVPIMGTTWALLRGREAAFKRIYDNAKTYSPLYRIWHGPIPTVVAVHPKYVELLTPAFHFSILEQFIPVFWDKTRILVEKLKSAASANPDGVDVVPYVTRCALDMICQTAMGTNLNAQEETNSPYVNAIYELTDLVIHRMIRPWLWPKWIFSLTNTGRKFQQCVDILHKFTLKVIQERRKKLSDSKNENVNASENDLDGILKRRKIAFLDLLIRASEKDSTLTDEDIREEVDTFMFESRCVEELEEIFCGSDRDPNLTDLGNMKYLERVIKESLRLRPSVFLILRQLKEPITMGEYTFPPGTKISMQIINMHHDPELYPDPEKFDPDRFLPDNCVGRHPYAYIPFSAGPRNCIGQKFAMLEMKEVLSTVIRHFRLETVDPVKHAEMILVAAIVALITWILWRSLKRSKHAVDELPGPRAYPIVGTTLEFLKGREAAFKAIDNQSRKYAPLYRTWHGSWPTVHLLDPRNVELILTSSEHIAKGFDYDFLLDWLGTGLLTSSETAMGTNIDAQEELNSPYVKAIYEIADLVVHRLFRPWLWPKWMFMFSQTGRRFKHCVNILHSFTLKVIRERREELTRKNDKGITQDNKDEVFGAKKRKIAFLDLLLRASQDDATITDEDIREEVDTFMFEGHDTTAMAINRDPNLTDLGNMKYIERVIKETLRLRPSVSLIVRKINNNLEIEHHKFPAGTKIVVQILNMHRNPEVYPDPEKFDPDRFLPENCIGRHPYAYIPFSAGPRNCIGAKWHSRRKLLTPAFHFSILEQFVPVFCEKSRILVEKLRSAATVNPSGETAMGTPINAQNDKKSPYVSAIHEINVLLIHRMLRAFIPDWIFNLTPAGFKMRKCLTILHDFTNKHELFGKGTDIQIDIYNVHRNPENFPDPEKFDPDRFLPDNCVDRHPFAYIPFSAGPRNCIGQRFALLEEKAVISTVLRKFEIRATCSDREYPPIPDLILRPLHGVIQERRVELKNKLEDTSNDEMTMGRKKRTAFLDLLISMSEKDSTFSDDDIREEVDTFMFEGHDTTAMAMSWALYFIGTYPEIQAKCVEELESIFQGSERDPTTNDLLDGHELPPGIAVQIDIYNVHHNPEYFPDPEKFDPDRFLPDNCVDRHPFAYIPFSAGPRNCIGQRFALLEEKAYISCYGNLPTPSRFFLILAMASVLWFSLLGLLSVLFWRLLRRDRRKELIDAIPGPPTWPILGNVLTYMNIKTGEGGKWHSRRKLITPAFHFSILEQFVPVFCENSRILVETLRVAAAKNPDGVDIVPYITIVNNLMIHRMVTPFLFPGVIFHLSPYGRRQRKCLKVLHDFTNQVIRERKQERNLTVETETQIGDSSAFGGRKKIAFLDLLIEMQKRENFTDEDIREEVDTFMFEGHDTTAIAMSWILHFIAFHPQVQAKCVKELKEIFGNSDRDPILCDLNHMKYLERVIKESLRLRPSVYSFSRNTDHDIQLDKYTIPKGTDVSIDVLNLHRNPEIYPDPEKFDPDRFLPENCVGRHPYAYIPFSAGPRNCIGQKFAMFEMKAELSFILRNFELQSKDDQRPVPDLLLRPQCGVKLRLIPRILFKLLTEYAKMYPPIYRIWWLHVPMVKIGDPKYLEIFLGNAVNITKSQEYDFVSEWLGRGLLTSTGSKWHSRRKLLTPTFHFSILEQFVPVFCDKTRFLIEKLQSASTANPEGIDIVPYITMCTLDIISETAMGVQINAQQDSNSTYVSTLHELVNILMQRMFSPWLYPDFIYHLSSLGRRQRQCVKILHDFTRNVIRERQSERNLQNDTDFENDKNSQVFGTRKKMAFLDLLLGMQKTAELSDEDIREEVDTFMFEGHDTVSTGLSWTFYFLSTHPQVQTECMKELEEIFGDSSARDPELRVTVTFDMFNVHLNPELYPDPEKFDPDRFLPENCVGRHPYAYIPFSAGPRNCIGAIVVVLVWRLLRSDRQRKLVDKIPGPRSWPIVGSIGAYIHLKNGKDAFEATKVFAKQYPTIYRKWFLHVPFVKILDPKYMEALLDNTTNITKSQEYDFTSDWLGRGILTSTGEKWHSRRKLLTPVFDLNVLEQFIPVFCEKSHILVEKLQTAATENSEGIDIVPYITRCSLDISCQTSLGISINAQDKLNSPFVSALHEQFRSGKQSMEKGLDSSAVSLSWASFFLGCNPQVQEKCVKELEDIFGDSSRDPELSDLNNMKYLERVIKESLRLRPAVWIIGRRLEQDLLLDKYKIPSGVTCSPDIYNLHHNPKIYPDPEKFDPDRFLPENCVGRHPFAYLPFGAGLRNCIGQKFAMLEMKVTLSTMLRHFKIHAVNPEKDQNIFPDIVLRPQYGVTLQLTKRS